MSECRCRIEHDSRFLNCLSDKIVYCSKHGTVDELLRAAKRALPYMVSHQWEDLPKELQEQAWILQVEVMNKVQQAIAQAEKETK